MSDIDLRPEHNTETVTAMRKHTEKWFFTEAQMIEIVRRHIKAEIASGTTVQFYSSFSPAYMRWKENTSGPGPTISNGYTLSVKTETAG